ncbi:MAG TPA: IPT/TIG domain-containing protein [Blastocatellia bacterium]|nr:IPT/TIG domain-containing protein [Blastocatellia bacterium]
MRSAPSGDEVTIIGFDVVGTDEVDPSAPTIDSISPDSVEQGRLRNVKIVVIGSNFSEGASLLVNGVDMAADLIKSGRALQTKLPRSLFDQAKPISIQVKAINGAVSVPRDLNVVRPGAPLIDKISPAEVAGPSEAFTLTVKGSNFRVSSAIVVAGQPLNTQQIGTRTLQAVVPAEIAGVVKKDALKVQVKDLAVSDLESSNDKDLLIFGPRVNELVSSVDVIVAGDPKFSLRINGDNFREGAEVRINGVPSDRVFKVGKKLIKLVVNQALFQDAGKLSVVVRNITGGESDPKELDVHGPEIESLTPGKVFAGVKDARIDIFGKNFRRKASVYVRNGTQALQIARSQIRFRNDQHMVVTLSGESSSLLVKPDTLQFEVVNRNAADGVVSVDHALNVVGPSITDALIEAVKHDDTRLRLTINGENFRAGAVVDFVKDGAVVLQQTPVKLTETLARVIVRARKIDALGSFQVRVVNPGATPVPSTPFEPHQ